MTQGIQSAQQSTHHIAHTGNRGAATTIDLSFLLTSWFEKGKKRPLKHEVNLIKRNPR